MTVKGEEEEEECREMSGRAIKPGRGRACANRTVRACCTMVRTSLLMLRACEWSRREILDCSPRRGSREKRRLESRVRRLTPSLCQCHKLDGTVMRLIRVRRCVNRLCESSGVERIGNPDGDESSSAR